MEAQYKPTLTLDHPFQILLDDHTEFPPKQLTVEFNFQDLGNINAGGFAGRAAGVAGIIVDIQNHRNVRMEGCLLRQIQLRDEKGQRIRLTLSLSAADSTTDDW